MTDRQKIALANHCRLAAETCHPRFFSKLHGRLTLILTVNSGYE